MKTEKLIVIFLLLETIINLVLSMIYFNIPYWISTLMIPSIDDISRLSVRLMDYTAYTLVIIGVIQLLEKKELKLIKTFSFPIYYFFTQMILSLTMSVFSQKFSYFHIGEEAPMFILPLRIYNILFALLIIYHFVSSKTQIGNEESISVDKKSRFINRMIDVMIVMGISYTNYFLLTLESDGASMNTTNPYWFFCLNFFVYYFIMEIVFLQTIGKLHNNAYTKYEEGRFKSIGLRTLSRFIPFDALSFLGEKGWHDTFSNTTVIAKK